MIFRVTSAEYDNALFDSVMISNGIVFIKQINLVYNLNRMVVFFRFLNR